MRVACAFILHSMLPNFVKMPESGEVVPELVDNEQDAQWMD